MEELEPVGHPPLPREEGALNALPEVRRFLEGAGHLDLLDVEDSHSRRLGIDRPERRLTWDWARGLGMRRIENFRAVHRRRLRELAGKLEAASNGRRRPRAPAKNAGRGQEGPASAESLAWRGRLRRLLGDDAGARKDLETSLKIRKTAEAACWLGELALYDDPARAEKSLEDSIALDRTRAWPHLWRAVLRVNAEQWEPAERELAAYREKTAVGDAPAATNGWLAALLLTRIKTQQGNLPAALKHARALIAIDPASPAGRHLAGELCHRQGDQEGSRRHFNEARNVDMEVQGTYLFESLGANPDWSDPPRYLRTLDAAIVKFPGEAILYAERAELKRHPRLCRYEEALLDYRRAAELSPGTAWIVAVLARAENNLHGGRAGMREFDRAIRLCPSSGWMRAWRGAALARAGEGDRALADFSRAEALMPWYAFTYAWRGALHNRTAKFREAERDLDVAIGLDPFYPFSFFERFKARAGLKDYRAAVEDLNRAFQSDPKYTWLGPSPGGREAAVAQLAEAVRLNPDSAWLHAWNGLTGLRLGDVPAAARELDKAIALRPREALMRAWRGEARWRLGKIPEATADLRTAIRLEPRQWLAFKILADIHIGRKETRPAYEAMGKVVELSPTTVSHLMARARLAFELGLYREALSDLERAAQLDPGYAQAYAMKAQVRLALNEEAAASREIDRAMACAEPPGLAFLVRGMIRQKKGEYTGLVEDFKRALALAPELFTGPQRESVLKIIGGRR